MLLSAIWSWLEIEEGERPLESGMFQILWAMYLAGLAAALMGAANARGGGYRGFSLSIVGIAFLFGVLIAVLAKFTNKTIYQIGLAILSGLGFWGLIWIGIDFFPSFSHYGDSPKRPLRIATAIYSIAPFVVFGRLQRPISAPLRNDGSYSRSYFQTHFDNSWRISRAILSLTAIIVVGVFFPLAALMTQRQDIHLLPLTIFVGGLLSAFLVLGTQFMYEIHFLEKSYQDESKRDSHQRIRTGEYRDGRVVTDSVTSRYRRDT